MVKGFREDETRQGSGETLQCPSMDGTPAVLPGRLVPDTGVFRQGTGCPRNSTAPNRLVLAVPGALHPRGTRPRSNKEGDPGPWGEPGTAAPTPDVVSPASALHSCCPHPMPTSPFLVTSPSLRRQPDGSMGEKTKNQKSFPQPVTQVKSFIAQKGHRRARRSEYQWVFPNKLPLLF